MHVERLSVAHIIRTPDAVDQLVTRHHTALVLHEVFEQFEFLEREEHGFAAYGDLMLANLHGDIATHQRNIVIHSAGSLGSGLIATHHGTNTCQQLTERVRLGHIIVRTNLKTNDLIDFGALGGEHNNRHTALLTNATAQCSAVNARQHQIKQHQIDAALGEQFQTFLASGGGGHVVPLACELVYQRLAIGFLVFDDKNACHSSLSWVCSRAHRRKVFRHYRNHLFSVSLLFPEST